MSFVPNLLGIGGGATSGGSWQAANPGGQPTSAIQNPVTAQQTQDALNQQQNFLTQLNAQNGLGNQSQVYGQMQGLAGQLQGIANGDGPNPALAQLAQTTGQNVAQTAALQAGQRGGNANVGLLARQIGQQGAATQQQAAGQAATLGAQQQLAGIGALQSQQANLANLAGTQAAQQQNAIQQYTGNTLGGIGEQNQANVTAQGNLNSANASIQNTNAQGQQKILGGLLGGVGSAAGLAMGGAVPAHFVNGGVAAPPPTTAPSPGPQSWAGKFLSGANNAMNPAAAQQDPLQGGVQSAVGGIGKLLSSAITSAAMSGGMSKGGNVNRDMRTGGKVGGKPKVGGAKDSYANDTVPAKLSPGEIVLPRSVTKSDDPVGNAAKFVAAVMAKQRMRRGVSR